MGMVFVIAFTIIAVRYGEQTARAEALLADLRMANAELAAARERERDLAVAEERVRLARDIHDGLGHHLTVLNVQLQAAAKLLGLPLDTLKHNAEHNIRGGAALLAQYARTSDGTLPTNEGDWYGAVVRYGGDPASTPSHLFAQDVFATLGTGAARTTVTGQQVALAPGAATPNPATVDAPQAEPASSVDCPADLDCRWAPAAYQHNDPADPEAYSNYSLANREQDGVDIRYIVIHDTETPYYDTIRYFQDPQAEASAHYVLRSSDGEITQMVENRDVAWTAGNWYINAHAINFEHEGYAISGASWYTETMYRRSARLARYLADKYGVPLDRGHIIGHDEVPGVTPVSQTDMHWDPGPFWDWQHYMNLVGAPITAQGDGRNTIVTINPDFATNRQSYSDAATQPSNMLHLYTAPNSNAPLLDDPALPGTGTSRASDWGNKAVTGQQFVRFARQGEWDGIYYGGQQAWFYNPNQWRTVPGSNMLVTPKPGRDAIPVYGAAYPQASAFPEGRKPPQKFAPLQYAIPAGQVYVAYERVTGDYFSADAFTTDRTKNVLVRDGTTYFIISFNHRLAFVRADDVEVVGAPRAPLPYKFYIPSARAR
jgi:N-acetyl-anhydromuramyl-L-alanine amidase AmpD